VRRLLRPRRPRRKLGRSTRVVITLGMPALVYRQFLRAHRVKPLERNVLSFVGVAPVHEALIGLGRKAASLRHP
jgi:hypothetical protein